MVQTFNHIKFNFSISIVLQTMISLRFRWFSVAIIFYTTCQVKTIESLLTFPPHRGVTHTTATNTIKIESLFNSQVSDPLIIDFFNKLEIDSFSFSKNSVQQFPNWKKILSKPQIDILINEIGQTLNQMGYLNETSW